MSNDHRRSNSLKRGPEPLPRAVLKRLYCKECGALRDARRVGRAAEYTMEPCGHTRLAMTSEQIQERNEETGHAKGSPQGQ